MGASVVRVTQDSPQGSEVHMGVGGTEVRKVSDCEHDVGTCVTSEPLECPEKGLKPKLRGWLSCGHEAKSGLHRARGWISRGHAVLHRQLRELAPL